MANETEYVVTGPNQGEIRLVSTTFDNCISAIQLQVADGTLIAPVSVAETKWVVCTERGVFIIAAVEDNTWIN